jgi:hypothetical protein
VHECHSWHGVNFGRVSSTNIGTESNPYRRKSKLKANEEYKSN